jgi:hypothetical protein
MYISIHPTNLLVKQINYPSDSPQEPSWENQLEPVGIYHIASCWTQDFPAGNQVCESFHNRIAGRPIHRVDKNVDMLYHIVNQIKRGIKNE